jgi:hypothetical protein
MKRGLRKLSIAASAVFITLNSCGDKDPQVISDGKMRDLTVDITIAQALSMSDNTYASDSMRRVLRQSIFRQYDVTEEQYDSAMSWYGRHMDKYDQLYTNVQKALPKRQKQLMPNANENAAHKKENSLWPYSEMAMISAMSAYDGIKFSLPITDAAKGERIIWQMRLSKQISAGILLGVDYTDGSSSYTSSSIFGSKQIDVRLQLDSILIPKRIYGQLRIKEYENLPVWIDSIALYNKPFTETEYSKIHSQTNYKYPDKKYIKISTDSTSKSRDINRQYPQLPIKSINSNNKPIKQHEIITTPTQRQRSRSNKIK